MEDSSPYALCPNDPTKLRTIISYVDARNADAREASTQRKDDWGWAWWVKACDALDTPSIRLTDSLDETRESYMASFALMYTAAFMKPRSKADSNWLTAGPCVKKSDRKQLTTASMSD